MQVAIAPLSWPSSLIRWNVCGTIESSPTNTPTLPLAILRKSVIPSTLRSVPVQEKYELSRIDIVSCGRLPRHEPGPV